MISDVLIAGNALISSGSYVLTQEANEQEIEISELLLSGILGGILGKLGESSKETARIAQNAFERVM